MNLENFDFYLPEELIAKFPNQDRSESNLLIVDKKKGNFKKKNLKI